MTTQRCKVLISLTCAVMAIVLILPPTLAFFIAGYAAEAARQKAYEPANCTVLDIRLFQLTCRHTYTCLYRAVSFVQIESTELNLKLLQQMLTPIFDSKTEAYSSAVESWGYISKNYTCYFDTTTYLNSSTTSVDWALLRPDPIPFLIGSCVLLGVVVIMLLISTIFFIRWYRKRIWLLEHPVVHPVVEQQQQGAEPGAAADAAGGGAAALRRSRVSAKQATIDLIRMDLEASADADADEDVCGVCFAHHISVKMVPCSHAFTCASCGQYFVNRPCGLCRVDVTGIEALPKLQQQQNNTTIAHSEEVEPDVVTEPSSPDPSDYSASESAVSVDDEHDNDTDNNIIIRSSRINRTPMEDSESIGFESSSSDDEEDASASSQ